MTTALYFATYSPTTTKTKTTSTSTSSSSQLRHKCSHQTKNSCLRTTTTNRLLLPRTRIAMMVAATTTTGKEMSENNNNNNWVKNVASVQTEVPLKICWQLWQDRTRIPNWMPWIASVSYDEKDKTKTKWTLETEQFGQKLSFSWTAKDLEPIEYERIAWKSEDGLRNRGSVTFKQQGQGEKTTTKIEMAIEYEVPSILKPVGELVSPLVGSIIGKDLERFDEFAKKVEKQLMKNP